MNTIQIFGTYDEEMEKFKKVLGRSLRYRIAELYGFEYEEEEGGPRRKPPSREGSDGKG